jgi:Ca-activated chloride channel homolog
MLLRHTLTRFMSLVFVALLACTLNAEVKHVEIPSPFSNVLMPQSRHYSFAPQGTTAVRITQVEALVDILDAAATTTVEISLENNTNARQEAELMFPVPDGAVIRGFAYDGPGGEVTARVLPMEEAKKIYEQLVAKIKDPALVEFAGYNLVRSSVFPIDAGKKQKVRLTYENLLTVEGNRLDYCLPRSESVEYNVPWTITVNIKSRHPISTVYSSSHEVEKERKGEHKMTVKLTSLAKTAPGPFRLSYMTEQDGVTASMFAYPDDKGDSGYFLLLVGLPADAFKGKNTPAIKREITLVIDHSGSMRGEKIAQVKEAAQQIIAGLKDGETFNIIIYSDNVERFSDGPVVQNKENAEAARKYIDAIRSTGGTNLHEALRTALEQKPAADTLGIVLFLTDGLPTVGNTSEVAIRELVTKSNPYNRRVFTFGVGVDLNAPLLQKIAEDSRAKSEFVLPNENVEVKVGRVFRALTGPVLTDPQIHIESTNAAISAVGRITEMLPSKLPDMFDGDQLILLGRHIGTEPVVFDLMGNYLGTKKSFAFKFDFVKASSKNGFVPRLWASRKIAELSDTIRQMGADGKVGKDDPKIRELVSEIVKLSTEYGILTEYTAFLAREGTDFHHTNETIGGATDAFYSRAVATRAGLGGVNQSYNMTAQKSQSTMNYANEYYDQNMQRVSVTGVQQINDRAYYHRGNRWVDSRLVSDEAAKPAKTIEYGSPEFFELLKKLETSNQQGSVALGGEILLLVDGERVLVK